MRRPNLPGQRTLSSAPALDEEWLGRMSSAIEAVATDLGIGGRFVAFEADQDGELHRRLAERLAVDCELVEPTVDSVLGAVGRARAVFTMRYHGAIAALRRPWESRSLAVWALCLSLVSVIYSAGWLWWASTQGPLFG